MKHQSVIQHLKTTVCKLRFQALMNHCAPSLTGAVFLWPSFSRVDKQKLVYMLHFWRHSVILCINVTLRVKVHIVWWTWKYGFFPSPLLQMVESCPDLVSEDCVFWSSSAVFQTLFGNGWKRSRKKVVVQIKSNKKTHTPPTTKHLSRLQPSVL